MALSLIDKVTVGSGGAASISFTSIPQTYRDLILRGVWKSTLTTGTYRGSQIQVNGDTGANYAQQAAWIVGSLPNYGVQAYDNKGLNYLTNSSGYDVPTAAENIYTWGSFRLSLYDYTNSSHYTPGVYEYGWWGGGNMNDAGRLSLGTIACQYRVNTAITSIQLSISAGNIAENSKFWLYGQGV